MSGNFLLIYICNFHVLSNLLLIYICKLHWNLNMMKSDSAFITVWKLPELTISHELRDVHFTTCWAVSPFLNFLGLGSTDGIFKLYSFMERAIVGTNASAGGSCDVVPLTCRDTAGFLELIQVGTFHDAAITAISFCEESRIIVTSGLDTSAMFWDYKKRFLRTIIFNNPLKALAFTNKDGDCVITQRNYLLMVISF